MMRSGIGMPRGGALVLAALLATGGVEAAVYRVGVGNGCTHATAQAALDALNNVPGSHQVLLSRSVAYTQQALSVDLANATVLTLQGGYATCDQAQQDGVRTVLNGAGGSAAPVLYARAGSRLVASRLEFRGGEGGGIQAQLLNVTLNDVVLSGNTAGCGGGISISRFSTLAPIALEIGDNVSIVGNTARFGGGGVCAIGAAVSMTGTNSIIGNNEATGTTNPQTGVTSDGYGGGVYLQGLNYNGDPDAAVLAVGSVGQGNLGAIWGNRARYGGGIALEATNRGNALARLTTESGDVPAALRGNFASVYGGGAYLVPSWNANPDARGTARLVGQAAVIEDNNSPVGAAVYLANDGGLDGIGAELDMDFPLLNCTAAQRCNRISNNDAVDEGGVPSAISVIQANPRARVRIANAWLTGNRYGSLLQVTGTQANGDAAVVVDSLVTGNQTPGVLFRTETAGARLTLGNLTIAANAVGLGTVILNDGPASLFSSIVYQPGSNVFGGSGARTVDYVLANEVASLAGSASALAGDPRFVDPAAGDYRLGASSPTVDFAPGSSGADLAGTTRGIDLPVVQDRFGTTDLGAFERPSATPIAFNADFDTSVAGWNELVAGVSSWNAANAGGGAGSGSLFVSGPVASGGTLTARSQCAFLPGPGRYRITGYARSVGAGITTRDQLYLNWQLRHDGTTGCNGGAVDGQGSLFLSSSSGFVSPAVPAEIEITTAQWTRNTSLVVALAVTDVSVVAPSNAVGYFDAISIVPVDNGPLFASSFE